jgi:hypothetical protein
LQPTVEPTGFQPVVVQFPKMLAEQEAEELEPVALRVGKTQLIVRF